MLKLYVMSTLGIEADVVNSTWAEWSDRFRGKGSTAKEL